MKIRSILPALSLGTVLILAGCIALPIPTTEGKVLAGRRVSEEQLTLLSPGITTQEQVIEQLGNPDVILEDVHVFAYHWEVRQGLFVWGFGSMGGGAVGAEDIPKRYVLLVEFDPLDRIARFESAVRPLTQSYADFLRNWLYQTTDPSIELGAGRNAVASREQP